MTVGFSTSSTSQATKTFAVRQSGTLSAGAQLFWRTTCMSKRGILPGFGLSMGYATFYASLVVFIPLIALFAKAATLGWADIWRIVSDAQAVASYKLSFGASLAAALINLVFGLLIAWVLVRYRFPGKRIVDALVDLPFALP